MITLNEYLTARRYACTKRTQRTARWYACTQRTQPTAR